VTFAQRLEALCRQRASHLCIGLDPVPESLPPSVLTCDDPVFAFNRAIVDATLDITPVYKPNLAFYEALGAAGWTSLRRTIEYVDGRAIVLGDAKRGDVGETARAYARALFGTLGLDACTLNPYIGRDSIEPFFAYPGRGIFVVCHTSNPSAGEIQEQAVDGEPLYLRVARLVGEWDRDGQCGLVVGATYPAELRAVRAMAPRLPLLVPGVGAQGGDARAAAAAARPGTFVVNSSRGVIYASAGRDFAATARAAAVALRDALGAPTA
jgi:orotidine-5'-phosphate decarboxylase